MDTFDNIYYYKKYYNSNILCCNSYSIILNSKQSIFNKINAILLINNYIFFKEININVLQKNLKKYNFNLIIILRHKCIDVYNKDILYINNNIQNIFISLIQSLNYKIAYLYLNYISKIKNDKIKNDKIKNIIVDNLLLFNDYYIFKKRKYKKYLIKLYNNKNIYYLLLQNIIKRTTQKNIYDIYIYINILYM